MLYMPHVRTMTDEKAMRSKCGLDLLDKYSHTGSSLKLYDMRFLLATVQSF